MKITIYDIAGVPILVKDIAPGWTHLTHSLGVHSFAGCLRFTNGVLVPDAGEIRFGVIVVDFDRPATALGRLNVRQTSTTRVEIGRTEGGDTFSAQRSWRLRYAVGNADPLDRLPVVSHATIGQVQIPFPAALRGRYAYGGVWRAALASGARPVGLDDGSLQTGALGFWQPMDDPQQGPGGFHGIDPVQGAERDSATTILRHDLTMERYGVDCLDPLTGDPVASPQISPKGYVGDRGPYENAKLPAFWRKASTDPYDNRMVQRVAIAGPCGYASALDAYEAHNFQHLVRAFGPAFAAWRMHLDDCAEFDLQMIAADARYSPVHRSPPIGHALQGSTWYGRREPAWVSFLFSELDQRNTIARETANCQMSNSHFGRIPSVPDPSFNPRPWLPDNPLDVISDPLPLDREVEQSQEGIITVISLIAAGQTRAAIRLMVDEYLRPDSQTARRGQTPRFWATGIAGRPVEQVNEACGPPDFAPILGLGLMMHADRSNRDLWIKAACKYLPRTSAYPNPVTPAQLYVIYQDYQFRQQACMLLSALEGL